MLYNLSLEILEFTLHQNSLETTLNKIIKAAIYRSCMVKFIAMLYFLLFFTPFIYKPFINFPDCSDEIVNLNQVESGDNTYISTGTISTLSGSSSLSDTSLQEREVIK